MRRAECPKGENLRGWYTAAPFLARGSTSKSFFLAFLVLMTIFVPMVGESRPGRIAIDLTFALMLFSGAIATVNKRMLMSLIIALTILEFTADLIVEFNPSFSPKGWVRTSTGDRDNLGGFFRRRLVTVEETHRSGRAQRYSRSRLRSRRTDRRDSLSINPFL